jgi:hypothetical protein
MRIILEDENRNLIKQIPILTPDFGKLCWEFTQNSKLLKYIDPYGDTVFNHLQMDDLIAEITDLLNTHGFKYPNNYLKDILILAKECKDGIHKYIRFYGD